MTAATKRRPGQSVPVGLLLTLVTFAPTVVFYAGVTTSLTLGATLAGILSVLIVAACPVGLGEPLARATASMIAIMLVLSVHLLFASLLYAVDFPHALASFAPLLILSLGGVALAVAIQSVSPEHFNAVVHSVFAALCLVALLPIVGLDFSLIYPGNGYAKPIYPFTEPSHFALIFMPFYLYACVTAQAGRRLMLLGLGLVLILGLESLTLALGWLIVALICMRGLVLPVIVVAALAVLLTVLDLSYFLDRLDFSDANQNLSTLVYLQGWDLASEALTATHGWGEGFQQLGLQGTNSPTSQIIYALTGNEMNILDGGFVLAKLVGELGYLGMIIVAGLLTAIVRSVIVLRKGARLPGMVPAPMLFAHAVFAGFLVELLVRGTGYFAGTTMLLVTATVLRNRFFRSVGESMVPSRNAPLIAVAR
ncbi:hypothetical protein [Polymorphobacter megasporae]|uniref:hypothetical protein n=1 Tax=Glacieibacterium megasporae TaxID=2835787 RepID=UPI001C1DD6C4|nr:hypothetical protein [Polymorphobacter megasporae]UAJ10485.1 hypothetical protein KTC28_01600 [Polymorphobacter megasporae]